MALNNMKGSISEALGDLEQLTVLHLGGNRLEGSIPEALGDLKQLQSLYLYGNQLEGSIPEALVGLEQLTVLELQLNRLTGVVPSLPFKNYSTCWLQDPASPSNHYTCPLPPVSPRVHHTCQRAAPHPPPARTPHTRTQTHVCPNTL